MNASAPRPSSIGVVLVPGACHGGWWYQPLVAALDRHGLASLPVTLTGLGADDDGTSGATLTDHVQEVRAAIAEMHRRTERIVLVGHSYAGSVITGAADHDPDTVDALVYLDAFVPEHGDSCYSMTDDQQRRWYIEGAGRSGSAVDPLPFFDPRARPHPLATLVQTSRLTGAWRTVPIRHYVVATEWPDGSPFAATVARLRREPGWRMHEWATRHNVLHDGPGRVLALLLDIASSLDQAAPAEAGEP